MRNIRIENVLAESITIEDADATRPVLSNVAATTYGTEESAIEDDMGGAKTIE